MDDTLQAARDALRQCFHDLVVFQKWRWPCLHCPSKGVAVDKQANDDVVHLCCFRKADGLADQAFGRVPSACG